MFRPAPHVLAGDTADVYFLRTRQVMEAEGLNPMATMEVFPHRDGLLCGVREVEALLREVLPKNAEAWALDEGETVSRREVMLRIGAGPNMIQLLEPLDEESTVQKAIDRNGGKGGLHHVALRVKDAQLAFDDLKRKGFRIIDEAPRRGGHGSTVFFLHPKGLEKTPFNVLIEVVQD